MSRLAWMMKNELNDEKRLIISSNIQIFTIISYDPQKISIVQLLNKPSSQLVTHSQSFFSFSALHHRLTNQDGYRNPRVSVANYLYWL